MVFGEGRFGDNGLDEGRERKKENQNGQSGLIINRNIILLISLFIL
jgi:hypothetical protein